MGYKMTFKEYINTHGFDSTKELVEYCEVDYATLLQWYRSDKRKRVLEIIVNSRKVVFAGIDKFFRIYYTADVNGKKERECFTLLAKDRETAIEQFKRYKGDVDFIINEG